ncbi:Transposable element Tc1 transposase [Labeo rohita]|uniref:Transposable element Tc1 transposase n=1 Tax=Labeo rohita TaxID=84645 RepID=A0ABQ8LH13_LABRO|nr:Transposable element Tc1 transposase [Labeo rohita]
MGRGLPVCQQILHNIIKRFKESGGISVRKGQGRKPKLNNRDLRSLRRHCIKNRHSSIRDITTWAQDYFGKPLSSTTIHSYIHKCQLKLYCAKRKPYVNSVQKRRRLLWARRHLGWTITQWKRVLWSDESVFQKTSFPGTPMHISTRRCKTTFYTHYKVLAAEEEDTARFVWTKFKPVSLWSHPLEISSSV